MDNFSRLLAFFVLAILTLAGCSSPTSKEKGKTTWEQQSDKIKILCTTEMIGDLVRAIGGNRTDVVTLIRGELNPHTYEFVKGDSEKAAQAQIIFYNGLSLEHGASLSKQLHSHPCAIGLGDLIAKKYPERILWVGNQPDPHIWMDIDLWSLGADFIVEYLCRLDPGNFAYYTSNSKQMLEYLRKAHEDILLEIAKVPENKRYLVSSHDAFNYYARAYLATDFERKNGGWETRCIAPEGLAPESQISPHDLLQIINHLEKFSIETLFPEANLSKDSIRKLLDAGSQKGLSLKIAPKSLFGDTMGEIHEIINANPINYIEMIKHNTSILLKAWIKEPT